MTRDISQICKGAMSWSSGNANVLRKTFPSHERKFMGRNIETISFFSEYTYFKVNTHFIWAAKIALTGGGGGGEVLSTPA